MSLTMKKIADMAGVSAATVSRIINGNENVSQAKREKVMKIAASETEHWKIRGRKGGNMKCLGLLTLPGCGSDMRAVSRKIMTVTKCLPRNFSLRIFSPDAMPLEIESQFLHGQLSGLFLCGHSAPDSRMRAMLEKIPHVWLNSHISSNGEKIVLMGNEFAGKLASCFLSEHRCRRKGVLALSSANPGLEARIVGFRVNCFLENSQCLEIKLELPERPPESANLLPDAAIIEKAIHDALAKIPAKNFPDGIFSPEEELTPILYRCLASMKRTGRRFPLVVSCNHTPEYLAGLYPRPASIDLHPETLARLAVDELMARLEGAPGRPDNVAVVIQPQLVQGEATPRNNN